MRGVGRGGVEVVLYIRSSVMYPVTVGVSVVADSSAKLYSSVCCPRLSQAVARSSLGTVSCERCVQMLCSLRTEKMVKGKEESSLYGVHRWSPFSRPST